MPPPSIASTARQLQLTRTARMAGEAFAFVDLDEAAPARSNGQARALVALGWLTLAAAAAMAVFGLI